MIQNSFLYSPYFGCLYDESGPVRSRPGRWHFSVFQCAEWFDVNLTQLPQAKVHKFSILWDEDHDVRVVEAVQNLYLKSMLAPVVAIGETKGSLYIWIDEQSDFSNEDGVRSYESRIRNLVGMIDGDSWSTEVIPLRKTPATTRDYDFSALPRSVHHQWGLGLSDFQIRTFNPPLRVDGGSSIDFNT